MKLSDIPKFKSWGNYSLQIGWNDLEYQVKRYIEDYNLNLDPDYQRGRVWTAEQRTLYCEYILKGGKAARDLILNCPGWNDENGLMEGTMEIVDGKQRLESVLGFLNNDVPVFGVYYQDFEDNLRRFRHFEFTLHIADLTRREVLELYLDLNTGGTVHSNAEIERVKALLNEEG
jgi:hypothetical protein